MKSIHRVAIIIGVALIGLVDALYLLAHRITGEPITCGLSGGCNVVAASPHSVVFGVPLSLLGVIFYFGIIILVGLRTSVMRKLVERVVTYTTALRLYACAGLISSAYFTYLQAFVIQAWCQYCILSAICTCIIFILIMTWREDVTHE